MKKRKTPRAKKLPGDKFILLFCATALLITCGIGTGVVIINFGAANVKIDQSVAQEARQPASAPFLVSRNPVARIYDKVARLNQLQRELNGLPSVPAQELRPVSMQLKTPPGISEKDALKNTEQDLDGQINRLEQLLEDNG